MLLQVAETLPAEVLAKMGALPKPADIPVLDPSTLPMYDGFIFGIPTRFGMMASLMKAMFDATGGLWQSGALMGKPAGVLTSSGTQGGGIETTALTAVTQFAHHGMIFVPTGYSFSEEWNGTGAGCGGSRLAKAKVRPPASGSGPRWVSFPRLAPFTTTTLRCRFTLIVL